MDTEYEFCSLESQMPDPDNTNTNFDFLDCEFKSPVLASTLTGLYIDFASEHGTKSPLNHTMSAQKSQRLTIRVHNIEFLKTLALQMGIVDLSEALNYLLLDCKGLGYAFGNKPAPTLPQQPQAPIGYAFDTTTFEKTAPIQEIERNYIDPTIQRLIDAGLEMEF